MNSEFIIIVIYSTNFLSNVPSKLVNHYQKNYLHHLRLQSYCLNIDSILITLSIQQFIKPNAIYMSTTKFNCITSHIISHPIDQSLLGDYPRVCSYNIQLILQYLIKK